MNNSAVEIIVLGIMQDGGYPQAGCYKPCCKEMWLKPNERKFAVSLAIVDKQNKEWWLIEATPDFREQLNLFREITNAAYNILPNGILLTHGHIGHYTGLMHLGMEAIGTNSLPIFVQARMKNFLTNNGPWSQLVKLNNIDLQLINTTKKLYLNNQIEVESFKVPHRDEYTETVGFKIYGQNKSLLFIPDIDKWEKWGKDITLEIEQADMAIIDGSFYKEGEIERLSMAEIGHPFIVESIALFEKLSIENRKKIYFAHLNHTNPVLKNTEEYKLVKESGFNILEQGKVFSI